LEIFIFTSVESAKKSTAFYCQHRNIWLAPHQVASGGTHSLHVCLDDVLGQAMVGKFDKAMVLET